MQRTWRDSEDRHAAPYETLLKNQQWTELSEDKLTFIVLDRSLPDPALGLEGGAGAGAMVGDVNVFFSKACGRKRIRMDSVREQAGLVEGEEELGLYEAGEIEASPAWFELEVAAPQS